MGPNRGDTTKIIPLSMLCVVAVSAVAPLPYVSWLARRATYFDGSKQMDIVIHGPSAGPALPTSPSGIGGKGILSNPSSRCFFSVLLSRGVGLGRLALRATYICKYCSVARSRVFLFECFVRFLEFSNKNLASRRS